MKKIFYRVCNTLTEQGLWYDFKGNFTGLIRNDFNFCKSNELRMDFDTELIGWLSATDSIESLWQWFTQEEILKLQEYGYFIHVYLSPNYKMYERFQHFVINQKESQILKIIKLSKINEEIAFSYFNACIIKH